MSKTCSQDFQLRVSDLIIKNKFLRVFQKNLCQITRTVKKKKKQKRCSCVKLDWHCSVGSFTGTSVKEDPSSKEEEEQNKCQPKKVSLEEIVPVEENPDDPGVPKGFASNKLVETAVEKRKGQKSHMQERKHKEYQRPGFKS